jgi:hypothetical protein
MNMNDEPWQDLDLDLDPVSRAANRAQGPLFPQIPRGVRRGGPATRSQEGVRHFAQKQQIRNKIITGGTG